MEPVVLDVTPASLGNAVRSVSRAELDRSALTRSFTELMTTMHDVKVAAIHRGSRPS
jgi:hypothetical protein